MDQKRLVPHIFQGLNAWLIGGECWYCFLHAFYSFNQICIAYVYQQRLFLHVDMVLLPSTYSLWVLQYNHNFSKVYVINHFRYSGGYYGGLHEYFLIMGATFESCLEHLVKILERYVELNLVFNWDKYHFIIINGIVLEYKISHQSIQVD